MFFLSCFFILLLFFTFHNSYNVQRTNHSFISFSWVLVDVPSWYFIYLIFCMFGFVRICLCLCLCFMKRWTTNSKVEYCRKIILVINVVWENKSINTSIVIFYSLTEALFGFFIAITLHRFSLFHLTFLFFRHLIGSFD